MKKHFLLFVAGFVSPIIMLAAPAAQPYDWENPLGQTSPSGIGFSQSGFATDGDGSHLVYALTGGRLYISTDSGVSWEDAQPVGDVDSDWYAVASDADGSNLIAIVLSGRIYISSDSGANWIETRPNGDADFDWVDVASDADGSHLFAAVYGGRVYVSTNGGDSWAETQPAGDTDSTWTALASDDDGSHLIIADESDTYVSSDGGDSWNATGITALDVASDADGSNLIITDGEAQVSVDGGETWTPTGMAAEIVASNADGSNLLAASSGPGPADTVFVSKDGGENWIDTAVGTGLWNRVVSDSDGSNIFAIRSGGGFFAGQFLNHGLAFPYLLDRTPSDDAVDVATSADVSLVFSETVSVNAGNIVIYKASDDSVVTTIDVTSGEVTGGGTDTITINPTADLEDGTEFYILIDAGTFIGDDTGYDFLGLDDARSWSFTTLDEPEPVVEEEDGGGGGSSRRHTVVPTVPAGTHEDAIKTILEQLIPFLQQLIQELLAQQQH